MADDRLGRLRTEGGVFELGPRTRIRVTGEDRLRYLNGQTSNDLKRLPPGGALSSLVLTAKGKLCALVNIWNDGDALVVDSEAGLEESLAARLERYAIADDVIFLVEESPATGWHAFGPVAESLDGIAVSRLGVAGKDVHSAPPGLLVASAAEVEILRLERGVPRWGREFGADTLPQEMGLERTAVDFHKGCYVGQEVVSRLESVGRVNRVLTGLIGDFDPASATTLKTAQGDPAGTITSAGLHPDLGRSIALAVVSSRLTDTTFVVLNEMGACLGEAERSEFPIVS